MRIPTRWFLMMLALLGMGISVPAAEVTIQAANNVRHVKTAHYEAQVAEDGCLTNLRIAGQEFLKPGVSISRGTYFFQGGPLTLPTVEQPAANVISAKGDKAAVKYEFAADSMTWSVENLTPLPMLFFIIFDPAVNAVMDEKGEFHKPVVVDAWTKSTWFREKSRLEVDGSSRFWGPWEGNLQVLQVDLAPNGKHQVTLRIGSASAAELAKVSAVAVPDAPVVEQDLTLLSPRQYQVFQRQSLKQGRILVSGRIKPECDSVEMRVTGKSLQGVLSGNWEALPLIPQTRAFFAELDLAAGGWYQMELRAFKKGNPQPVATATLEKFGVGELFVGAGQSNSTNCGQERIKQNSGMVASFGGSDWRLADDPQPGVHDHSQGGSFWPAFGDAMYAKYQVPIGVAATGHGGTSVNAWKPGGDLFNWMMTRIHQLGPGGFRAVLWHQGESDVGMTPEEYGKKMTEVINASTKAAGWQFPWFVAQVSYHNPAKTSFDSTRSAQQKLWESGVALEGPDTDTLKGDNRDNGGNGIHFSPKGLAAHGQMWTEKVALYLDKLLKE